MIASLFHFGDKPSPILTKPFGPCTTLFEEPPTIRVEDALMIGKDAFRMPLPVPSSRGAIV
jgi:hypothetical protein